MLPAAIERNSGIVLSLPSAGVLRHLKSRFLGDAGAEGIWVEAPVNELPLINELLSTQKSCVISFKHELSKVMFHTPLVRFNGAFKVNAEMTLPALLVTHPTEMKVVQRRSNYRVNASIDETLSVRIWRMSPQAALTDRPITTAEVPATVRDLSIGGLGVTLKTTDAKLPKVSTEDRLRVLVSYADKEVLLEGRLTYLGPTAAPGAFRGGLEFVPQQESIESRRAVTDLTKIIGELQRIEIRRFRMGMARQAG